MNVWRRWHLWCSYLAATWSDLAVPLTVYSVFASGLRNTLSYPPPDSIPSSPVPQCHICVYLISSPPSSPASHIGSARNDSWKNRVREAPRRSKSIQSGTFEILHRLCCRPLKGRSFQDALRTFFQPIKNDDARLDFYTMYKKEATEYDTDYVKKYDEDLNTTLIFVRRVQFASASYLTCFRRRVCSPPSVPPSSSTSTQSSNPTRTSNQQPSSAQSFSLSTSPPSQTKPPPYRPHRKILPARSSLSLDSCTRVF